MLVMQKYNLSILPSAQAELEDIANVYLELAGVDSAKKIINGIYDSLEHLKTHPNMGFTVKDKYLKSHGYRILISDNYICIYRLIENTIFVYHIANGRSDYPKLFNGLKK